LFDKLKSPFFNRVTEGASNDNEADRNAAYKMADLYDLLREENPDIYNNNPVFSSKYSITLFGVGVESYRHQPPRWCHQ
jgi:hypothetical protein